MTCVNALASLGAATLLAASAAAADPALIYDMGGKFDKSFNEAAYEGAERWAKETGGSYKDIEMQNEAQREQALRRFAESGANPIVTTGFSMSDPIAKIAPDFPDTKFVTIDGWVDPEAHPNVKSVGFAEQEGSYLVGMIAAMASKTGTLAFVGGMDIPLIRNFGCGFAQGVKAQNPEAKFLSLFVGTTPAAWNDPVKAAELTKALKSQGADVIYAAAGQSGLGVLQAAADEKIYSIGVDSNQNHLHPGSVLTSMMKRVDVAVYEAFKAGADLDTSPSQLDLKNDGVSFALDANNEALIDAAMRAKLAETSAAIISGALKVHDYRTDDHCPAATF